VPVISRPYGRLITGTSRVPAWGSPSIGGVTEPVEPPEVAAERARERLHEEIERVRVGVEEMLAEQENAVGGVELRRELDAIRAESSALVKRRVRKAEKRLNKRIDRVDRRAAALERRLEEVEQDRRYAEWRIHTTTEQMLDGLLREVRAIADLLTRVR
jgi:chromosome segregation ATPase